MLTAYIALGANLPSAAGPPAATLAAAAERLASLGRITARSSLYSTAPVGVPATNGAPPRFLNSVVALETGEGPLALLSGLLEIELAFGRDRNAGVANGPRTLDLDILLYGDLVICESCLEIPHPRFAGRAFVLVPLKEIAPSLRDPRSGNTIGQLLENLPANPDPDAVVAVPSDLWAGTKPE